MLVLEVLYLLSVALLAVYGLNSLVHVWLFRRSRRDEAQPSTEPLPATDDSDRAPMVTVQLPIYNERYVVARLIDAVAALDWPADRLHVQILDDSTDDTSDIIAAELAQYRESDIHFEHVRRPTRKHYKAGALQHGLATAAGEFVAIFDADFIPSPDFLRRTIPCFADETVGCVQTRWGHVNPEATSLTRVQALGIDGHFLVEQYARHTIGALLNFNGTAGVWRRACLHDAGGWEGDTLTEDLDLSYRAQLRGWRIAYRPDVVVPAELPVQIDAFKRQQFRWAKGSIQTALKLCKSIWDAPQPLWRKVLGTLHLTNYAVHPLMVINLLLTLPMSLAESWLVVLAPIFTVGAVGPPLLYWVAAQADGVPWSERVKRLPLLIAVGTGLSVNNTRAAIEAIAGIRSAFKRTPKFAVTDRSTQWQASNYALPRDPTAWVELLLAMYAFGLLWYGLIHGIWWLVVWLALYAAGYSYVAGLAFVQAWQTRTVRRPALNAET